MDEKISKPPEVAAKPLKEMTKEERKRRYSEYKKKQGKSKLEVIGGDPNRHYFWAGFGHSAGPVSEAYNSVEMVRLEYDEYTIVKVSNPADVLSGKAKAKHGNYEITAGGLRQDGTFVIGDVILMSCPQEVYEFHMLDVEERSEAQISASVEQFKTTAAAAGVPTFEPPLGTQRG